MSEDATEQFSRVFARFGGRVRYKALDSEERERLEEFHLWYGAAKKNSEARCEEPQLPVFNVHLDFVENKSFNAIATQHGNHEFIGIFTGAVNIIYRFFYALFSSPQFLPEIGNPSTEAMSGVQLQSLHDFSSAPLSPEEHPRDPTRFQASLHLAFNAVWFLIGHETAHIGRAHLYFLRSELGWHDYVELPIAPVAPSEAMTLRGLELDADEGGATYSYYLWRKLFERGAFPAIEPIGQDIGWVVSIFVLFRIMGALGNSHENAELSTHPPPDTRLLAVLYWASTSGASFPTSIDDMHLNAALESVNVWWKGNQLPDWGNLNPDDSATGFMKLVQNFPAIQKKLHDYTRVRSTKIRAQMASDQSNG